MKKAVTAKRPRAKKKKAVTAKGAKRAQVEKKKASRAPRALGDMLHAPPGAPPLEAVLAACARLVTTIAWLRDPKDGCPWDLVQTHDTLRRYMIEEPYEAAAAMADGDDLAIRDELGDVMLQVVLNAQLARDRGAFDLAAVFDAIDAKMRRRHPHVFARQATYGDMKITSDAVHGHWAVIKAAEKAARAAENAVRGDPHEQAAPASAFAEAVKVQPAAMQALAIGKIAHKIHFDWDHTPEVLDQVESEVAELAAEVRAPKVDAAKVREELGDVYFSLAQLCRHLDVDAETVALDANRKFLKRFAALEAILAARGATVASSSREQLEAAWQEAKRAERKH